MGDVKTLGGCAGRPTPSNGAAPAHHARHTATLSASIAPVLLDDPQAAALFNVSERTFHELRASAWWPVKPIKLGPRLRRWPRAELEAAIACMPREENVASEPAHLRRAKIDAMKRGGVAA